MILETASHWSGLDHVALVTCACNADHDGVHGVELSNSLAYEMALTWGLLTVCWLLPAATNESDCTALT
jgi:hypothetical protein